MKTQSDLHAKNKAAQAASQGKVKKAHRDMQMEEYRQYSKNAGKGSSWRGDPEIEKAYKLQEMVKKLRSQYPDLTDGELMELARMQMGMIDPGISGKAQSRPGPSTGTPYVVPARPPQGKAPAAGSDFVPPPMPILKRAPEVGMPPPPQPKGGTNVHSIGASKVAFPGWMADEAEHRRYIERQQREMELRRAQQQAEEMDYGSQMKRQEQEMALQKMREEMEYDRFMRDLERQKAQAEMRPALGGLVSMAQEGPQRKPVSYLGG